MISIITVCYNSDKFIATAIDSVLGQKVNCKVEYIIVDGQSKDKTLSIIRRYGKSVSKLISEPDLGIYDAMNKGLSIAEGDIIGFLNSDDLYSSNDVLQKMLSQFFNADIDACYGDLLYVARNDLTKIKRHWRAGEFTEKSFSSGWAPPHPTFFARKKVFDQYGNFNLEYPVAADFDLMARFLNKYKVKSTYIPEVLVKMRAGGRSDSGIKNIILQNVEILKALKNNNIQVNFIIFFLKKIIFKVRSFL